MKPIGLLFFVLLQFLLSSTIGSPRHRNTNSRPYPENAHHNYVSSYAEQQPSSASSSYNRNALEDSSSANKGRLSEKSEETNYNGPNSKERDYTNSQEDQMTPKGGKYPTRLSNVHGMKNMVKRLSPLLLDRAPNAEDLMFATRKSLKKLSVQEAVRDINEIQNVAISTKAIHPVYAPEKEDIKAYLATGNDEDVSTSLNNIQQLASNPKFRPSEAVTIFITGFSSDETNEMDALKALKRAYNNRRRENLIIIDISSHLEDVYSWSTLNVDKVGEWIAESIMQLKQKVPVSRIHLVGHSMGAHLAGKAARRYTEMTGDVMPRITGLDPARLFYKKPQSIVGLQRGDAQFVDVIHTSAYALGKEEPMGDVDFYPNGPSALQPGSMDLVSSHERAIWYFAESAVPGNEHNFLAYKSNSINNLNTDRMQTPTVPMGIMTPFDAQSGNYFLETRNTYPYGLNQQTSSAAAKNLVKLFS